MNSRIWIYFLFLGLFISFSTFAETPTTEATPTANPTAEATPTANATPTVPKTNFPATLTLGDQKWELANNQEDDNLVLGEYITGGEKIDAWTQLVTFQKFKFAINKEVTPAMFAQSEIDELNKQKYKMASNIIESNPQEALMEFRISSPEAEQQDEIQRIIKTPDDKLIVLHYVIKKADMGDEERNKWIDILKKIDISFLN